MIRVDEKMNWPKNRAIVQENLFEAVEDPKKLLLVKLRQKLSQDLKSDVCIH